VFNDPDFKGRIIDSRSWIPNEDPHGDDEGHGTHSLGLILRIAPTAEVFVARVIKSNKDEREDITSQIADVCFNSDSKD
jgi:subtilisin family serine protease